MNKKEHLKSVIRWQVNNPEKFKKTQEKYRLKIKEKRLEDEALDEFYKERSRKYAKEWRLKNKEKSRFA